MMMWTYLDTRMIVQLLSIPLSRSLLPILLGPDYVIRLWISLSTWRYWIESHVRQHSTCDQRVWRGFDNA